MLHQVSDMLQRGQLPAVGKVLYSPAKGGWLFGWGATADVPSAVAGWAKGAIFIDCTVPAIYYNSGTSSSCTFTQLINDAAVTALALTTTPGGASYVGVYDVADYFTGTTVEAILAELGRISPKRNLGALAASAVANAGAGGSYYMTIGSAGAETNTLAAPTVQGAILSICATTVGTGTRVVTVASAINKAGNNTITFAAAGDRITLIANAVGASTLAWRVLANDGPTLSTV